MFKKKKKPQMMRCVPTRVCVFFHFPTVAQFSRERGGGQGAFGVVVVWKPGFVMLSDYGATRA